MHRTQYCDFVEKHIQRLVEPRSVRTLCGIDVRQLYAAADVCTVGCADITAVVGGEDMALQVVNVCPSPVQPKDAVAENVDERFDVVREVVRPGEIYPRHDRAILRPRSLSIHR